MSMSQHENKDVDHTTLGLDFFHLNIYPAISEYLRSFYITGIVTDHYIIIAI